MEKKKSMILTIVAIATLVALVVGATFAYFQAQGGIGSVADVRVTTYTTDLLTFTIGDDIAIYADQSNFADGLGNQSGATFAKAHLLANSKTNSATANYYVYLYIPDNSFVYSQEGNTPELLLQVTNPDGVEVTSIDGLDYKTVIDGKGQTIKGFDITTKLGMLTLVNNHGISATPETQETWNINVVFVNLDADQNLNTGKDFQSQLIITKDNYDDYTPAMVHTISTSIKDSNLTVSVNASEGTEGIAKYYYALKENNAVAMNASKVTRLSNALAVNSLEYVESDSSSYTFTNINESSNYEIYTYVIDGKKTTSNIYNTNVIDDSVVLPSISKVEVADKTQTSLTVSVTATAGTNAIYKYYYSIDNGKTYAESTSSTYTFNNLTVGENYNIKVKVNDVNENYSYEFEVIKKFLYSLAEFIIAQYDGIQGNNNIYYHDSSLENGAGDNSYRYAGASDSVNNYVCFGADDEICPNDNLYRIIGVFDGKVKLIKFDYATSAMLGADTSGNNEVYTDFYNSSYFYLGKLDLSLTPIYYWNKTNYEASYNATNYYNDWSYSELNKTNLNTNYINYLDNIDTKWVKMIANTIWNVGGVSTADVVPSELYKNEMNGLANQVKSTYESKVGLMYLSDYSFAGEPSSWTKTPYKYYLVEVYGKATANVNWMYMGLHEWIITRSSGDSTNAYYINHSGDPTITEDVGEVSLAVRPVFYLNSDVTIANSNSDGSKTNPYRLS